MRRECRLVAVMLIALGSPLVAQKPAVQGEPSAEQLIRQIQEEMAEIDRLLDQAAQRALARARRRGAAIKQALRQSVESSTTVVRKIDELLQKLQKP